MLLNGLSRTNGQSVSVRASRRPLLYTLLRPVSHLMRRESARTLLSRNCLGHGCMVKHFSGLDHRPGTATLATAAARAASHTVTVYIIVYRVLGRFV